MNFTRKDGNMARCDTTEINSQWILNPGVKVLTRGDEQFSTCINFYTSKITTKPIMSFNMRINLTRNSDSTRNLNTTTNLSRGKDTNTRCKEHTAFDIDMLTRDKDTSSALDLNTNTTCRISTRSRSSDNINP